MRGRIERILTVAGGLSGSSIWTPPCAGPPPPSGETVVSTFNCSTMGKIAEVPHEIGDGLQHSISCSKFVVPMHDAGQALVAVGIWADSSIPAARSLCSNRHRETCGNLPLTMHVYQFVARLRAAGGGLGASDLISTVPSTGPFATRRTPCTSSTVARRISATLHACAMHPTGRCG